MTALAFLLGGAGLVLIFAGIRDEDPREVIVGTVKGTRSTGGADRITVDASGRLGAWQRQQLDYGRG